MKLKIANNGNGMIIKNFSGYFLIFCLALAFIGLYQIFLPFLMTLVLAAILATAFNPVYERILKVFKGRARLASLATCFLILVLIVVPLIVFVLLLGKQAYDTYLFIYHRIQEGFLDHIIKWEKGGMIYDWLIWMRDQFGAVIDIEGLDIKKNITDSAQGVASWIVAQGGSLIKGFGWFFVSAFVLFFALYYFFKDADLIKKKIMMISPLPEAHEHELFRKFKEISLATLFGIFLTSIAQGFVCGIGFVIVGIPNALFWGTGTALFSLIPMIGTSLIWMPASILLLITGNVPGAIFLFLWGMLLVSTIDNFLRAFLIGGRTNTNQLLTFLAVFGGLMMFGLIGVIFGPLILAAFFTLLHIYEMEYKHVLHNGKK